ncbi:MAG TPA: copper homeostasis protein CutC [Tissierellales bacterium]|nr:copper homeostasis protein CutC [Tissierellales bacterium]
MDIIREACVGNYKEAKRAYELGADRIELCDNLMEGGTTPSYGTILQAKKKLNFNIFVIIRPRGGNFVYTEEEISIMEKDIELCKKVEVDGVVFGILTEDNKIDEEQNKRLIEKAEGLDITFHMAFDEIENSEEAIDTLVRLGVSRILTKGGKDKAINNLDKLKELVECAGDDITILAGGGVTKDNYMEIINKTGIKEVHGSKIVGDLKK